MTDRQTISDLVKAQGSGSASTNGYRYPVWTARCKSGFTFERVVSRTRIGRLVVVRYGQRACGKTCARGELLCSDCATAVVVEREARQPWYSKLANAVRVGVGDGLAEVKA